MSALSGSEIDADLVFNGGSSDFIFQSDSLYFSTSQHTIQNLCSNLAAVPAVAPSPRDLLTPKPSDRKSIFYREYETSKLIVRTTVPNPYWTYFRNRNESNDSIYVGTSLASEAEDLDTIVSDLTSKNPGGVFLRSVYEYQILFQRVLVVRRCSGIKFLNGEYWIPVSSVNHGAKIYVLATLFQKAYRQALVTERTFTLAPPVHCDSCNELYDQRHYWDYKHNDTHQSQKEDRQITIKTVAPNSRGFPPLATPCGCVLIVANKDCKGRLEPMRAFTKLPLIISPKTSHHELETLLRLEAKITHRDIYDRQCHERIRSRSMARRRLVSARDENTPDSQQLSPTI